jgi:hypothetical protein
MNVKKYDGNITKVDEIVVDDSIFVRWDDVRVIIEEYQNILENDQIDMNFYNLET